MRSQLVISTAFLLAAVSAAEYNPDHGVKAMYYSAAAYCQASSIEKWSCGEPCNVQAGVTKVVMVLDESQGTQGFVAYNALMNEIGVSFRGSTNIPNWVSNINFFQTPWKQVPGAQVHRGFLAAYTGVQSQVTSAVRGLLANFPTARVLITGHSLGGALASLAAVDLKEQFGLNNNFITFYTYGCPRVGNQAFSDYVFRLFPDGGHQRITHSSDVVPHLPPASFGFN